MTSTPNDVGGGDSALSRRNFLRHASELSLALSVSPAIARALNSAAAPAARPSTVALEHGILRETVTAPVSPSLFSGLKWRMLGPFRGGRCPCATGVPGRVNEFYFGHANGGVWKTIDAGRVWEPVFDSQPVASIGAITVAASAPDTVWVGTGESTLRDSMGFGNGVYKSTDAGKTWQHMGLDETHHIGKIAVDPKNPNNVLVAAIGKLYAANPERGIFKSTDGGKTWKKTLGDDNVGAVDVAIDPQNANTVYASLWATRRAPWYTYGPSTGPGGGLFKSTDGGNTWHKLTNGLPTVPIGRSGIAISPSNPRRVYAVVDTAPDADAGGFFRSDDAGATWARVSADQALWGRGWYFSKLVVDPKNPDIVYVPNVATSRTKDGGKTWVALRGSPGGDDYHQAWVSPDDSDTMIVASDQGAIITRNARADDARDVTWSSWLNQPTAQIYHLSVDYRFPYWVTGAQQDSGAVAVRSEGKFADITMRDWEPIGAGGESGTTAGDPLHPGIIFGGQNTRYDLELNAPLGGTTSPTTQGDDRADWTQPLIISRADPRAMFYASQYVYKTTDGAKTWKKISADLTRPSPAAPPTLDAVTRAQTDRNGQRGVIYALCPSPLLVPMIWAGTDDGLIHVTTNDGKSWQDVTPRELTPWSRVTCVEASHFDFNSAYASVSRHQLQDFAPHIYRTRDQGKTWQKIVNGLPPTVYVHVVKEDPMKQGLLFAGTERGVFVSFNDGDDWQPLQQNLPVTSNRDFEIYENDLIVATHGRGFWVIDDISVLRQVNDQVARADAFLFKPSDHINMMQGSDNGTPTQKDEAQTPNQPTGAVIDYYVKSTSTVTLEILDANGAVVGTMSTDPAVVAAASAAGGGGGGGGRGGRGGGGGGGGRAGGGGGGIPNTSPLWRPTPEGFSGAAGMHRAYWVPTAPTPGGGRGRGGGGRGGGAALLTGTFTAKLTVNGQSQMQAFSVRPDPRTGAR